MLGQIDRAEQAVLDTVDVLADLPPHVVGGELIEAGWGNAVVDKLTELDSRTFIETAQFAPTFQTFTPGSGTATGWYTFIGGPNVGDIGLLMLEWVITLGSGFIGWTAGHRAFLPTGFNFANPNHGEGGNVTWEEVATGRRYYGRCSAIAANLISASYMNPITTTPTSVREASLTATSPWTQAVGDRYHFNISGRGVRV